MIRYQMRRVIVAVIAKWIFHLNNGRIKILQDHRLLKLIMRIIVIIAKIARTIRIVIKKVVVMLLIVIVLLLLQQELRIQETE